MIPKYDAIVYDAAFRVRMRQLRLQLFQVSNAVWLRYQRERNERAALQP